MKTKLSITLTYIFIILFINFTSAQEWQTYISGNEVRAIAEDNINLYIGSYMGGFRVMNKNTNEVTSYNTFNSSLTSNNVTSLGIDSSGDIWIGMNGETYGTGGLFIFNGTSWVDSNIPSSNINDIEFESNGNVWVATNDGLLMFDGTNWITYLASTSGLIGDYVTSIAIDSNNVKWITSSTFVNNGGLSKFDDTNWTTYNTSNSNLPSNFVNSIEIDSNNNKWIGSQNGLSKFDGTSWTSDTGYIVNDVKIDSNNNIWIGTNNYGIQTFDGLDWASSSSWVYYSASNSILPSSTIRSIKIDNNDNVWIGTAHGIAKLIGTTITNIPISEISNNWIIKIVVDSNNNKWIATRGSLIKFDGINWTTYNSSNSAIPYSEITALTIDDNGNKWIGTFGGSAGSALVKFDDTNWTIYDNSSYNVGLIRDIEIDSNDVKWISNYGGGLVKYDNTNWSYYNSSNSGLHGDYISDIAIDSNDKLWICANFFVDTFDGTNWVNYDYSDSSLLVGNISSVNIDSNDTKWFGSDFDAVNSNFAGVIKYDDTNWIEYNDTNTPSEIEFFQVRSIIFDQNSNKLIGGQRGLKKFDGSDWSVISGGIPPALNQESPNGIYTLALDNNNDLWIGSRFGLSVYTEPSIYTDIPDDIFEQTLIDLGLDDVLDDKVLTANIDTLTVLNIANKNISDLTGIEDFIGLLDLNCESNSLTSLNVSQNTLLQNFNCGFNSLTSIDINSNTALVNFYCHVNQITSLTVSQNVNLKVLYFSNNPITSIDTDQNLVLEKIYCTYTQISHLDISQNNSLYFLHCENTSLLDLDVRNGNNTNFTGFYLTDNSNLTCIYVDNVSWSETNWTNIDTTATFVDSQSSCDSLGIEDELYNKTTIYPNPVTNEIKIESLVNISNVSIFTVSGQKIMTIKNSHVIDVSSLNTGIYFLKITNEKGNTSIRKIIKK